MWTFFDGFEADFVQIQGDGAFAVFWDELAFERAICSAVTIKTFSTDFSDRLAKKWPEAPITGYKVGMAFGRTLVKRIGKSRRPDWQEPVWTGKPVNYAVKAAQCGDIERLVVTGSVWDQIENNDYLAASCPCGDGPSTTIWADFEIDKLPAEDEERYGRALKVNWCTTHGEEFCNAILGGLTERDEVVALRASIRSSQFGDALRKKAATQRRELRTRRAGLSK